MTTTTEWADSKSSREEVWIRCIKCGWEGWTMMVTENGGGTLLREECPSCGMPTELSDDRSPGAI